MNGKRIVVADYGIGNLLSVCRALERCGAEVALTGDWKTVAGAERLVLPGVGAFGDCIAALTSSGLKEPVLEFVASQRPFLGICVGMQMLLDHSEEFEGAEGLGLIPGQVKQIPTTMADGQRRKIPHIGWAGLTAPQDEYARWQGTVLAETPPETAVYFVHSFNADPQDEAHRLAVARYDGFDVTAAVRKDNITGTQFHPEKSGPDGLRILQGFLDMPVA